MTNTTVAMPNSALRAATNAVRRMFGGRRRLIVLGAIVLGLGLLFKWNWLVAVGVAPLLLAALPCVAMCALGLCMGKMAGGSSGTKPSSTDNDAAMAPNGTAPLRLVGPSDASPALQTIDASARPNTTAAKSCCH